MEQVRIRGLVPDSRGGENIEKIKEKRTLKKGLKEKVISAPKELARRGLDDGMERLRGQFREAAQQGQTDECGGDRIEDTAAGGMRRAGRAVETLLKKKNNDKGSMPDRESRATAETHMVRKQPAQGVYYPDRLTFFNLYLP